MKVKSEKGSVTLFVLASMGILLIALISIYVSTTNKQLTQLEITEQIKTVYEKDYNRKDDVYEELHNIYSEKIIIEFEEEEGEDGPIEQ